MEETDFLTDKRLLSRNFNHSAGDYESAAVLQRHIAVLLDERLEIIRINPRLALDLGSGTGFGARLLEKRYRRSVILQSDLALNMLRVSRRSSPRFFSRQHFICADADSLPLNGGCVDLVYSNLMLQWCNDLERTFSEIRRVLKPGGLFLFSTLGPDTLKELRDCWRIIDEKAHVNVFRDMHDAGDVLSRCGFQSPVMEMEYFFLTYTDVFSLMRDLKKLGAVNINQGRRLSLTGKGRIQKLVKEYDKWRTGGRLPSTYEVIIGHAWSPDRDSGRPIPKETFAIPIHAIGKMK